jgi:uncharacterized protein (DUF983 family)
MRRVSDVTGSGFGHVCPCGHWNDYYLSDNFALIPATCMACGEDQLFHVDTESYEALLEFIVEFDGVTE